MRIVGGAGQDACDSAPPFVTEVRPHSGRMTDGTTTATMVSYQPHRFLSHVLRGFEDPKTERGTKSQQPFSKSVAKPFLLLYLTLRLLQAD